MARISTYAIESPAEAGDILLGSNTSNDTKNFTVGSIIDLIGINGTKDTIAMFGSGTSLKDSIITQNATGTVISIGSDDSEEVTTEATLNIQGPIKDSTGTLGGDQQILVSNASGNVAWGAIPTGTVKGTGAVNFVPKWSATDTLQDSIIFDNGTKVGIGTTTPLASLDVKETTTDVAGQIIVGGLIDADDKAFGKLSFANTAAANSQPNKILASIEGRKNGSSNRGILTFDVADGSGSNWEKMRIDSYGNVGIGTSGTNPADKLHVQGTVRAVVPGSSGIAFNAINGFGVSSTLRFDNNQAVLALKNNSNVVATKISSDGFSFFNGGGVGFGTTTPASPVEMVIPDTSSTTRGGLLLSEAGDSSTLDSVRVEYESNKNASGNPGLIFTPRSQPSSGVWETFFRFKTNGGELVGNKANLTVDGKVGIGTTNDNFASRLTVAKGDIEVTEYEKGLILRSTNGTRYRLVVADDGTLTTTAV